MKQELSSAYRLLMEACGVVAALLFGVIAVLVAIDVALRNLGGPAFPWIVEVSEYGLPLATFIAAPWVLYQGAHVRIEILLTALPRKFALVLECLGNLLGAGVCVLFLFYTHSIINEARGMGSMIMKTLIFPEWWSFLPFQFCNLLLGLEFVRRLFTANAYSARPVELEQVTKAGEGC